MPPVSQQPTGDEVFVAFVVLLIVGAVILFGFLSLFRQKTPNPPTDYDQLQDERFWSHKRHRYDDDPDRLNQ